MGQAQISSTNSVNQKTENGKSKIVFFEARQWEKEYLSSKLPNSNLIFSEYPLTEANVNDYVDAEVISVFINSKVDNSLLSRFSNLKMLATRSTGYDHIDIKFCVDKNIIVTNVPSYGENTVAEHAMALLLAITRRLFESAERVKGGNFTPDGLTGIDIKGKTVGVIGSGHIGSKFIKMVKGFDAKVICFDPIPNEVLSKDLGFDYVGLEYLLTNSDIISLHCPLNDKTKHIINADSIKKVKKGVIIINTARGALIETNALFDMLKSNHIGGAGLDTLEEEVFLKEELELLHKERPTNFDYKIALQNHAMAHLDNVIITPHNAFNSKEALFRILDTTIENIECYIIGQCKNIIN